MKNKKESNFRGQISISQKAMGYFTVEGKKSDIEIKERDLNTALNGDIVEISFNKKDNTGKVIKIVERAKDGFSGVLTRQNGEFFVIPDDPKMYRNIEIKEKKLSNAKNGDKVYAKIIKWSNDKYTPLGEITRVLGKPGDNDAEMFAIAIERGFDNGFNKKVKDEANKIKTRGIQKKDLENRKDLRNILTFTIDPYDAKDFDDAISFKKIKDDIEIGIHIADVSNYVTKGSQIDKEALKRGTSVYLVDRTIPMLPEVLSNDLCSLVPNKDRLTVSAIFLFDKNLRVKKEWYGPTVIHSDKRFTYEEAEGVINNKNAKYHKELSLINKIAKLLNKERFKNGAISLEQEEVKFVLDDRGKPLRVIKKQRGDSNRMIEELMLLANRKIAETIEKGTKKGVFVYRVHPNPSQEKMQDLIYFLQSLGYNPKVEKGVISNETINKLLETLAQKHEGGTIHKAVIRSMAKAIYSTKNIGHYGLAFKHYAHFTSPIRRYPDIVVHRILLEYLKGEHIKSEELHFYESIANKSSQRERSATEAERASIKYKQVEYMSMHKNEKFTGIISGITNWGIYIEELETKSEGMIRLKDLKDDYYIFDEKKLELIGEKKRKKYKFGDKVKIKVKNVDLEKKTIDYELI